ncbi:hypothetical protein, partial [Mesorhizobium japonicum]|uniref:hypothetical protein n=1 Tax=Mesorhizobium japonicum TaxID=2066070 RepID=UPI0019571FF2
MREGSLLCSNKRLRSFDLFTPRFVAHPLYLHGGDFVRWKRLSLEPDGHPIRGLAKSPDTPAATTVDEPGIFVFVTHDRIVAWL